eukprot:Amastigsp_a677999_116.p3 type:complete len:121 gc:universal Amastigsp_a677999_116:255-617(+)
MAAGRSPGLFRTGLSRWSLRRLRCTMAFNASRGSRPTWLRTGRHGCSAPSATCSASTSPRSVLRCPRSTRPSCSSASRPWCARSGLGSRTSSGTRSTFAPPTSAPRAPSALARRRAPSFL